MQSAEGRALNNITDPRVWQTRAYEDAKLSYDRKIHDHHVSASREYNMDSVNNWTTPPFTDEAPPCCVTIFIISTRLKYVKCVCITCSHPLVLHKMEHPF